MKIKQLYKVKSHEYKITAQTKHLARTWFSTRQCKQQVIMKSLLLLMISIAFAINSQAQILKPIKWSYAAKKVSSTEAIIYIKASINKGWHIYGLNVPENGPVKTSFTFRPSADYKLIGKTTSPEPLKHFEETFHMDVTFFENTVVFQQKVELTHEVALVNGSIGYMICSDSQCLPPENLDFSIKIN